jgi:hypothetical protein
MYPELSTPRYKPTAAGFTYEFACCIDGCNNCVVQKWAGTALIESAYPGGGWKNFGENNWVCPRHKVSIVIDGKTYREAFGWDLVPLMEYEILQEDAPR